jgi:putative membrane protein insertion efficiency factor
MIGKILIACIWVYQKTLSRVLPDSCIYYPSCSRYTVEAIKIHGALKGVALGAWRICRCHPFARGGHDPVPPRREDLPEDLTIG